MPTVLRTNIPVVTAITCRMHEPAVRGLCEHVARGATKTEVLADLTAHIASQHRYGNDDATNEAWRKYAAAEAKMYARTALQEHMSAVLGIEVTDEQAKAVVARLNRRAAVHVTASAGYQYTNR